MNIKTPFRNTVTSAQPADASENTAKVAGSLAQNKDISTLRIAVVSDAISGRNGVGTFYEDLLAQIEPIVDEIALISPSKKPDRSLERYALPMPGDATQRLAWPNRAEMGKRLVQVNPNLIVVPSLGPFTFFAVAYARKHHIPLLVVNHTDFDHILSIYYPQLIAKPLRIALDWLNRWLCKQAAAVGVMHVGASETAKRIGARNVRVMATPLSQAFLTKPLAPLEDGATRAIFVGRLAKEKGITNLLATVRAMPQTRFSIVGDGPLRKEVEAAAVACENLIYRGWLTRYGVLEEVDAADVLILPSAYETFGTVALEALARERYVIASSGCGIAEWPSLAEGIFVVSEKESLTKVLQDLQTMPGADRQKKARKSWDAVQNFNNQAMNQWLDLFQAAVSSANR